MPNDVTALVHLSFVVLCCLVHLVARAAPHELLSSLANLVPFSEGWTRYELITLGVENAWLAGSNRKLGFIMQISASNMNTPLVEAAAA